jgi:hypothetical protein
VSSEPVDNSNYQSPYSSHDCIDIVCDGPGDNTVRPATGNLLKYALAEREKMERYKAMGFELDLKEIDIICDGPGDTTVRPATGLLLKLGLAEREKMARYKAMGLAPDAPREKGTKKDG